MIHAYVDQVKNIKNVADKNIINFNNKKEVIMKPEYKSMNINLEICIPNTTMSINKTIQIENIVRKYVHSMMADHTDISVDIEVIKFEDEKN